MSFKQNITSEFFFPDAATAEIGARAQAALWASQDYISLYPYFAAIETYFQGEPYHTDNTARVRAASKLGWIVKPTQSFVLKRSRPLKRKGNVLIIGECSRTSEIKMMSNLVKAILARGLSILYLVRFGSKEFDALSAPLSNRSLQRQIQFIDPWESLNAWDYNLIRHAYAAYQAARDYERLQSRLPSHIYLDPASYSRMRDVAFSKIAWERVELALDFDVAIVRNHWKPLSAAAAIACMLRQKLTITFQHGVISAPTSFVPIVATRHICFGTSSQNLLMKMEQELAEATGRPAHCQDFVLGGSLFDELYLFPPQEQSLTLLVVDQTTHWAGKFYGIDGEFSSLSCVVGEVLERVKLLQRVIIRLHPNLKTVPTTWIALARRYPDRVEISNARSLREDLVRTTIALGLFSGALTVAAACGIPALFLRKPGWFYTPDLAPFAPHLFVTPEEVVEYVETLLIKREVYMQSRNFSLSAARNYYFKRQQCVFDREFVDQVLLRAP